MKHYCYTCMNEISENDHCPYCGRENVADNMTYRLLPGTVLNNKFLVGNCIGEGGFGITYIGRDLLLERRVAVKEYYPAGFVNRNNTLSQIVTVTSGEKTEFFNKGLSNFLAEARNIAKLNDVPGIVDVREFFEENGTAYIVMEYLDGVNLNTWLKQNGVFAPDQLFKLMLPITRSLQKIHEAGLIHRDITPDNIMYLRDGTLMLMDFGSARYFTNTQKEMSVMLKMGYAPEEQYSRNGDQGPWSDVYGLCATMYKCMTGRIPAEAIDRISNETLIPPRELGIPISDAIQNTLLYGMAVHKSDRCQSMQELSVLMESALTMPVRSVQNSAPDIKYVQDTRQRGAVPIRQAYEQQGRRGYAQPVRQPSVQPVQQHYVQPGVPPYGQPIRQNPVQPGVPPYRQPVQQRNVPPVRQTVLTDPSDPVLLR